MITKVVEATNGFNWGKFLLGRLDHELQRPSKIAEGYTIAHSRGWNPSMVWVLDLETKEGACFRPGGLASADLQKHRIWVCPLFQPFLEWMYEQDLVDLAKLPDSIDLSAPGDMAGHRREGSARKRGIGFARDVARLARSWSTSNEETARGIAAALCALTDTMKIDPVELLKSVHVDVHMED